MKKCVYCNKEFTPKNPKGKFCSDKCRVYFNRGKTNVQDLSKPTNEIKPKEQPQTNFTINTTPKNLEELRKLCPPELKGVDRGVWISRKRLEYDI